MKRSITKQEQSYINSLLEKRRNRQKLAMMTVSEQRLRMTEYETENKIGQETGRAEMTYLEVIQFDNTYNNFK